MMVPHEKRFASIFAMSGIGPFASVIFSAVFACSLSSPGQASAEIPISKRKVVASYFAWYQSPYFSGATKHWPPDGVITEHPDVGLYNIPNGRYDSADPNVTKKQMAAAKAIGIDAFMVSWWGGRGAELKGDHKDDYIDANFESMLTTAQANGPAFKLAIILESDMERLHGKDIGQQLHHALIKYGGHPNYLTQDGKPVVFIYNLAAAFGGNLDTWGTIFKTLRDAKVAGVFFGDAFGNPAPAVFDGLWNFGPVQQTKKGAAALRTHYSHGASQAASTHILWMPTAMAGFDDTLFRQPGSKVGRKSFPDYPTTMHATWEIAMSTQPDWMHVGTWNEWHEATEIEKSKEYGEKYQDILKPLIKSFKTKKLAQ